MRNEGAAAEGEKKLGKERLEAAIGGGQKRREQDLEVLHGENLIGDLQGDKRERGNKSFLPELTGTTLSDQRTPPPLSSSYSSSERSGIC